MKTSELLCELYKVIHDFKGPSEARQMVSLTVSFIIGNIQDENLPVTSEEIDRRLAVEISDFKSMAQAEKKSIA